MADENEPGPGGQDNPQEGGQPNRPILDESRNPFRAKCPNYHGLEWDDFRKQLIDDGTVATDDDAVAHLKAKWQENIEKKKEEWVRQGGRAPDPEPQDGQQEGARERSRGRREGGRGRRRRRRSPRSTSSSTISSRSVSPDDRGRRGRTDKKKKILPIPEGRTGPDSIVDPPARTIINKLKDFEYVELAHFTASARERAKKDVRGTDEETLAWSRSTNALTITTMPASSRNVRQDEDLTWDEVMQARIQYLNWLERSKWPDEYVTMIAQFFWGLDTHELRGQTGGPGILVRYQAQYRREWHNALREGEPFNLALINEKALKNIQSQVLQEQVTSTLREVRLLRFHVRQRAYYKIHYYTAFYPIRVFRVPRPSNICVFSRVTPMRRLRFRVPSTLR